MIPSFKALIVVRLTDESGSSLSWRHRRERTLRGERVSAGRSLDVPFVQEGHGVLLSPESA